jgi:hypothetical protein
MLMIRLLMQYKASFHVLWITSYVEVEHLTNPYMTIVERIYE